MLLPMYFVKDALKYYWVHLPLTKKLEIHTKLENKLEIDKKLEIKLEIYKNLENKLEIYSYFKLENELEFFVNGRWSQYKSHTVVIL